MGGFSLLATARIIMVLNTRVRESVDLCRLGNNPCHCQNAVQVVRSLRGGCFHTRLQLLTKAGFNVCYNF